MPRKKVPKFYAVAKGHNPGIYHSWPECEAQIKGFRGAIFKSFVALADAEGYCKNGGYRNQTKKGASVASLPPGANGQPGGDPGGTSSALVLSGAPPPGNSGMQMPTTMLPSGSFGPGMFGSSQKLPPPQQPFDAQSFFNAGLGMKPSSKGPPPTGMKMNNVGPPFQQGSYQDGSSSMPYRGQDSYEDKPGPKNFMSGPPQQFGHQDPSQYFMPPFTSPPTNANCYPPFNPAPSHESCLPNTPVQFMPQCSWNFDSRSPNTPLHQQCPPNVDPNVNPNMNRPPPQMSSGPHSLFEGVYMGDGSDDPRAKRTKHNPTGLESLIEAASGGPTQAERVLHGDPGGPSSSNCGPPPSQALVPSFQDSEQSFVYELEFAGTSKGNPGQAGGAAVLKDPFGQEICYVSEGAGVSTSNYAEYKALAAGLEVAAAHGIQRIYVKGKSELIVRQMKGEWQVRCSRLAPTAKRAKMLSSSFKHFHMEHVAGSNTLAHKLARKALELQDTQRIISKPQDAAC